MSKHRSFWWIVLIALLATSLASCTRDPNVKKQQFLKSGNEYFAKEKYREAAIQYLNAIKVDSRYAEAHYQLAQAYLKLQIYSGAYQELLRTVDLQPEHLKAHLDIGNLQLGARQFMEAQERAQLVLKKDPKNIEAHILLANSYAALQDLPASIQEMQTAIQMDPERAPSYLNLAVLQLGAKQADAAEASFKKAIELDPKSVQATLALGNFYGMQRRWADAELLFRRAVQLDPKNPVTHAALARLFLAQGNRQQSEEVLREAKKAMSDVPKGYRLLGDFYVVTGEAQKAVAEYGALYQQYPGDLQVKKNYAQLLIGANRLDEGNKITDEILKKNPKDVDAIILRAQLQMTRKQFADAVSTLESSLKAEADNAVLHFQLGRALAASGNAARAESEWREALRLAPNYVAAQQALSAVAAERRDWEQASKSADAVILNNPNIPIGYLLRASARAGRGDFAGAEGDVKKAMELAPQSAVPYIQLGALRASTRRYAEAEKLFERALELDPKSTAALQALVSIYGDQKQPAKSVARASAQVAKAPDVSGHYFILGLAHLANKESEQAEQALAKATDLDKQNVQAWVALAQVQTTRGSVDKAAASYQRAIEADPKQPVVYLLFGALEEGRNNWQRAQELYQKSLQAQPDFALAANNLAYLMLEHGGNIDAALSYAQVARRGLPDLPNTADTLAWAYYHKGAYSSAIDLLQEAVKKVPQNATYHYHLGMAYWKNNDKANAKQHLSRVLQLNPTYAQAPEIKQLLAQLS